MRVDVRPTRRPQSALADGATLAEPAEVASSATASLIANERRLLSYIPAKPRLSALASDPVRRLPTPYTNDRSVQTALPKVSAPSGQGACCGKAGLSLKSSQLPPGPSRARFTTSPLSVRSTKILSSSSPFRLRSTRILQPARSVGAMDSPNTLITTHSEGSSPRCLSHPKRNQTGLVASSPRVPAPPPAAAASSATSTGRSIGGTSSYSVQGSVSPGRSANNGHTSFGIGSPPAFTVRRTKSRVVRSSSESGIPEVFSASGVGVRRGGPI